MQQEFRIETDTMGQVEIPSWAYWGAQTQRAVNNFSVSGLTIPEIFIWALAMVKQKAAQANWRLGLLDQDLAQAVIEAAEEVKRGKWNKHFPVDVFQTGSGTSWNMNANEVIANRANQILGRPLGGKDPVHPNDHVNRGQSSNDVIPTCTNLADRMEAEDLAFELESLERELDACAQRFEKVLKLGRTHLQDAVPMTLGQEFAGFAEQIRKGRKRLLHTFVNLHELPIGGTAIGTGLNTHKEFATIVIREIARETGKPFKAAASNFEAIGARDVQVELMGALNTIAVSLIKIANDLRLLSGGPRAGLAEIKLPELQPGSSIMPGKVNPVIPEMVIQAAAFVMGKHLSVTIAAQNGPLQLNMMQPLLAYETLTSLNLLKHAVKRFTGNCVSGIEADEDQCREWIDWSLALVTPLALKIGYDKAAELAHRAYEQKKTIKEVALEEKILPEDELDMLLDPYNMI